MKLSNFYLTFLLVFFVIFLSACETSESLKVEDSKSLFSEEPIDKNVETDLSICYSDDDCIQGVLCGCRTAEYTNYEIEKANAAGIYFDACKHPPNSYCVCVDNRCEQRIDKEARDEVAEKFTINNSEINDIPNLINYNQEEISNTSLDYDSDYIISWPISLNQEILTDENIDVINLNLPSDLNMILERTEYSEDRWRGIVISEDERFSKNDPLFFSTMNNRFLATIMPYQIKNQSYNYTITNSHIRIQ